MPMAINSNDLIREFCDKTLNRLLTLNNGTYSKFTEHMSFDYTDFTSRDYVQ